MSMFLHHASLSFHTSQWIGWAKQNARLPLKTPLRNKPKLSMPAFQGCSAVGSEGLVVCSAPVPLHGCLWGTEPALCFRSAVPSCSDSCFRRGWRVAAGGRQSGFWKALQSDSAVGLQLRDPESIWHTAWLFLLLAGALLVLTSSSPPPFL